MEKYNGWANYFTWLVNLWLDEYRMNEPENFGIKHQEFDEDESMNHIETISELAESIRNWCEDLPEISGAGLVSDMINGAFSWVDWYEIAENMLDDWMNQERA